MLLREVLRRNFPKAMELLVQLLPQFQGTEVEEEVYFGLQGLLEQGEKLHPLLEKILKEKEPASRALAGLLLGRFGNEEQRVLVRKLLDDGDSTVRLRSAQGLLAGSDKQAIPTLIELLEKTPLSVAWQAEELLHYAANDNGTPAPTVGKGTVDDRRTCRAVWERWWQEKKSGLNLELVRENHFRPGLLLAFKESPRAWTTITIWLCGCEGTPRCQPYTVEEFQAAHLPLSSNRLTTADEGFSKHLCIDLGLVVIPEER